MKKLTPRQLNSKKNWENPEFRAKQMKNPWRTNFWYKRVDGVNTIKYDRNKLG